jgi:hypothetical protein
MQPRQRLLIILLALLLPTSLAAQTDPPLQSIVLPLDYSGNHLFVTLTDEHLGPLTLMLDTGFQRTALDSAVANKGEVHTSFWNRSVSYNGFGAGPSKRRYQTANISLRTAQIPVFTTSALVVDFSGLAKQLGHPIDGFLGWDFVEKWCATLDYAPARLILRDPAACPEPEGPHATLRGRWTSQGLLLPAQLTFPNSNAITTALLHFDTGSDVTLLLNTQFRAAAGLTPNPDSEPSSDAASAHESHGWGVNGRYTADLVPLAKIDLEDQLQLNTGNNTTTVIARPGAFAKIHWWEGPSATKINHDGVIGNGLLDRFTWTIDSAAKRIYAAPATGN